MNEQDLYHKYLIAFGGETGPQTYTKTVEKYNIRANAWQTMPNLNVARAKASGVVLGNDNFYVFGGLLSGSYPNSMMVEKLNLRNQLGNRFEILDVQLPASLYQSSGLTDLGVFMPSSFEALILGGFSNSEKQSQRSVFKLTAQELFEEESPLATLDFFPSQDAMQVDHEKFLIFGQNGAHFV